MSAENAAASGLPLCREPWENFYILRRGILPCCYGGAVIGEMADYAEVWNSPEIQEIRRYLSQGKLAPYCRENPGCPIVQRVLAQSGPTTPSPPPDSPYGAGLGASLRRLFSRITGRLRRTVGRRR